MTPEDASRRVVAMAEEQLAEDAKSEAMREAERRLEEAEIEANAITTRAPDVEAEALAAAIHTGARPFVHEALKKKWAAQIEKMRKGQP